MSRPVGETPYLPNAGRAVDIPGLNAFDQDLTKALFFNLSELARRANDTLPKDGQEPMTGDLDMGGFDVTNALTIRLTSTGDLTLSSTDHAFQIGPSTGPNLAADPNEIQARNNGAASTLALNAEGGVVAFHTFGQDRIDINGGQLRFPATQLASSGANDFDDYEEGTWTPVLSFGGGTTGITYTTQRGSYIKIGRLVMIDLEFLLTSKGSSTGSNAISGLPFASASTRPGIVSIGYWSGMAFPATAIDVALLTYGGSDLSARHRTATTSTTSDDTHFTNTSRIVASGVYLASA